MMKSTTGKHSKHLAWNFKHCPDDELGGCFYYEFARESKTILALACTPVGSGGPPPAWRKFFKINAKAAGIVWNLTLDKPGFDFARMSWFDLSKSDRKKAAVMAGDGPAFYEHPRSQVPPAELWPEGPSAAGHDLVPIIINWNMGLRKVIKDATYWLTRNRPKGAPLGNPKKGRHGHIESYWRDALRRLGALRLLSKHPLKQAIEISKGYYKGDSIYCGFIDGSGRPIGQTAWDNATKGAVKIFQDTFRLLPTEKPVSFLEMQSRRNKKPRLK
jgi:hypothetical protein